MSKGGERGSLGAGSTVGWTGRPQATPTAENRLRGSHGVAGQRWTEGRLCVGRRALRGRRRFRGRGTSLGALADLLGPGTGSRPLRLRALGIGVGIGGNSRGLIGWGPREQSAGHPEPPGRRAFLPAGNSRPQDPWPLTTAVCSSAQQTQFALPGEATGRCRKLRSGNPPTAGSGVGPAASGEGGGGGNLGRLLGTPLLPPRPPPRTRMPWLGWTSGAWAPLEPGVPSWSPLWKQ